MNQEVCSIKIKLQSIHAQTEFPIPKRCPKCNGLLFKTGTGFSGPVEIKCGKCKNIFIIH